MKRWGERGGSWIGFFRDLMRDAARHGSRRNPDAAASALSSGAFVPKGRQSIEDQYREFNWAPSKVERDVTVPDAPNEVFVIGRLYELQYLPIESSGKPHELHTHTFGDYGWKEDKDTEHMPLLVGNGDNLFIVKDKSKFTLDRPGIVG